MKDFPKRLQNAIDKSNMSQTELADRVGVSKSLITRYLKGECMPKTSSLINICKVLEVSPAYLLGENDVMEDKDGIELAKFLRSETPEIDDLSIEDRHRAFIYGQTKDLSLAELEKIEEYIQFIKTRK